MRKRFWIAALAALAIGGLDLAVNPGPAAADDMWCECHVCVDGSCTFDGTSHTTCVEGYPWFPCSTAACGAGHPCYIGQV